MNNFSCVVVTAVVLLTGCASSSNMPGLVDLSGSSTADWRAAPNLLARQKEVHDKCVARSNEYNVRTDRSRNISLGLASIGIIAGSIIVPALAAKATVAKSAVAAWGGVSGAANAGQLAMRTEGLSSTAQVKTYNEFRTESNKLYAQLATAATIGESFAVLAQIEHYCAAAAPTSEVS